LSLDAKNRRGDPSRFETREDRSGGSGGAPSPGGSVGFAMAASLSPAKRCGLLRQKGNTWNTPTKYGQKYGTFTYLHQIINWILKISH
jgi:hypothetical protein